MTHLFLFTIGPVQSFIAQARKTRDLYAGSRLLSELVLTGMDVFVKYGGEVIFPKSRSTSQPNRFLGRIDEDKLKEKELNGAKLTLRKLGKHIEKEVESQWQNVAKNSVAVLGTPDGFDEQIKNALETFWAFHPIDKNNYREAYRGIERTLGAIKNARPASQYHYQKENGQLIYGERGRKCSLDGERNVKFYRLQKGDRFNGSLPARLFLANANEVKLIRDGDGVGMSVIAPGEGLSAVSFAKRKYPVPGFEPTAYFAAADFISKIEADGLLKQKYREFKKGFDKDSWDEQLLFEENYTSKYFKAQGVKHSFDSPEDARKKLLKFFEKTEKHNNEIKKPNGYYALLLFDGDNMGKWLSGAYLEESDKASRLFEFHQDLANVLADYSIAVSGKMVKPKGKTVYAGGDDFLGFVTLEYLFPVLKKLRESFDEAINKPLFFDAGKATYSVKNDKCFTFSAGLVIAHYKTPLHVVLDWTRATEKDAKKYIHPHGQLKDTLGISVLKASGDVTRAFVPWYLSRYNEELNDTGQKLICTKALAKVTDSLRKDFSGKWLRNLDAEFFLMRNSKGELEISTNGQEEEMVKVEMRRLLKRACQESGDKRSEKVGNLLPYLYSLLGPKAAENFGNFSNLLYICDFIDRQSHGIGEKGEILHQI